MLVAVDEIPLPADAPPLDPGAFVATVPGAVDFGFVRTMRP
ncbi:hypothetical protein [Ilumatobacter sp.]